MRNRASSPGPSEEEETASELSAFDHHFSDRLRDSGLAMASGTRNPANWMTIVAIDPVDDFRNDLLTSTSLAS